MALRISAYHRRRGWAVWHGAALMRWNTAEQAFPPLSILTLETVRKVYPSAEEIERKLDMWEIATSDLPA